MKVGAGPFAPQIPVSTLCSVLCAPRWPRAAPATCRRQRAVCCAPSPVLSFFVMSTPYGVLNHLPRNRFRDKWWTASPGNWEDDGRILARFQVPVSGPRAHDSRSGLHGGGAHFFLSSCVPIGLTTGRRRKRRLLPRKCDAIVLASGPFLHLSVLLLGLHPCTHFPSSGPCCIEPPRFVSAPPGRGQRPRNRQ